MSKQPNEKNKRRSSTIFRFVACGAALGVMLILMLHPNTAVSGSAQLWGWLRGIEVVWLLLPWRVDIDIMVTIVLVCTVSGGFFGRWWDDTA